MKESTQNKFKFSNPNAPVTVGQGVAIRRYTGFDIRGVQVGEEFPTPLPLTKLQASQIIEYIVAQRSKKVSKKQIHDEIQKAWAEPLEKGLVFDHYEQDSSKKPKKPVKDVPNPFQNITF